MKCLNCGSMSENYLCAARSWYLKINRDEILAEARKNGLI